MGFQSKMVHRLSAKSVLANMVRFSETLFHIADILVDIPGDVVPFSRDVRSARLHGFFWIEDRRKRVILHFNQLQGLLGRILVNSRYGRNLIAYKTDSF